ncbi:MAG: YwiC-like family protein [Anaerolineae bacterium]|nr:YwiC-like family protein [Anaerolineae bacterium]
MAASYPKIGRAVRLWQRHIAIPAEHGSWVFLFSPLLIGLFLGGRVGAGSLLLTLAILAGFLIRQPVTIMVKAYSGRRPRSELAPARFWAVLYGVLGGIAVFWLVILGHSYVLWMVVPAIPVFGWHLWLVSRRAERKKPGVEIVASGVLALSAPAAYWVGLGGYSPAGWLIWGLCWLQAAGSIVYAYLRLEQRGLKQGLSVSDRIRLGKRSLMYNTFSLLLSIGFSFAHLVPTLLPLAFGVQWLETLWGVLNPAIGAKPTQIGIRQLAVSSLFTVVFIVTWLFF